MSSRVDKYIDSNDTYANCSSRVNRNAKLYRQVYGKYEDLDNLPIDDNADEIDMKMLKELISESSNSLEHKELRESLNVLDTRERKIDEKKVYDINKMLEKAKNDNDKLKDTFVRETLINKSILSTLESREISLDEIKKASLKYDNNIIEEKEEKEENLSMTREFKFKELSEEVDRFNSNPLTSHVMCDNDLSFDLFEELRPTGNTIVTKPIKEEDYSEMDMHSSDTKDIDIIKDNNSNLEEFFTNSYEFSKKDFAKLNDEDDFFETKKSSGVLKIILLILAIFVFAGAIVYFVLNYGLGV